MKKLLILFTLLFLASFVAAATDTQVSYFYSTTCPHCAKVLESGVMENLSQIENVTVTKYEITSPLNREKFLDYVSKLKIKNSGIPLMIIEQGGELSYLMGDTPIISNAVDAVENFRTSEAGSVDTCRGFCGNKLTLGVVVVSALIDSINPCAFGVLLFLMAVLLSMGSSKRALKSGLVYTFMIFITYLAAGLGIMKIITSLNIINNLKIVVGAVIAIGALIELKDFFWEGKGISLRIPEKAKPKLEKYIHKGTLPAIIILGILVAMVELPCTGGIYLAILSMIAEQGTTGLLYLVLYNLIFVMPLVIIAYSIYKGTKVEKINEWVQKNKRFMRLAAGIIMIFLSLSLFDVL